MMAPDDSRPPQPADQQPEAHPADSTKSFPAAGDESEQERSSAIPRASGSAGPAAVTEGSFNAENDAFWIGRYEVVRLIGSGGFADVYLAKDPQLQRRVAIKLARADQQADDDSQEAYLREARTAAGLEHAHIVPIYDVGVMKEGRIYAVSKYVEGFDLAAKLRDQRPTVRETISLVATVAEALHYAHKRGFVHRDVKPANILIDREGAPYLADFGLAVHEDRQRCRAGEVSGTMPYMAPEQARGEIHRCDGRVDIWALGVILYEMLTGRRPFRGSDRGELFDEILHREPKPLRQIDDSIPLELERCCLKALSKKLTERYSTAKDLAEDLRRLVQPSVAPPQALFGHPAEASQSAQTHEQQVKGLGSKASRRTSTGHPASDHSNDSLLQGRYRLLRRMAQGNLGEYHAALDIRLSQQVTIWLGTETLSSADRRAWFLDHVRLVSRFRHPHVVTPLNYDVLDDGRPIVVTESLDASAVELETAGPLRRDELASFVAQIGGALAEAHRSGLIHGSLKARNVVRLDSADGPHFVLLHLGIPELANYGGASTMSMPLHDVTGTPIDYAPEQIQKGEVTRHTDIYRFGALLYRLLTGHRPFEQFAPRAIELLRAILETPPPSPRAFTGSQDLPPALEQMIMQCLAKDPAQRPESMLVVVERCLSALAAGSSDRVIDHNVEFTVFRPKAIQPQRWYPLLAFAHLAERSLTASDDEPDPVQEVARQARQVLGDLSEAYRHASQESSAPIPHEGDLTFVPQAEGIQFNPARRSFSWTESVHREEFRLQAADTMAGQTARGRLSVFLGNLLIAEVAMAIRVEAVAAVSPDPSRLQSSHARRFRKIYVSCAAEDAAVVGELERYGRALGDEFLSAATHLRAAGVLDRRLMEMIGESDVFQLFWSTNSMRSPFVQSEWEYALSLARREFIRPVYWEQPLPMDPQRDMPPPELVEAGFQFIGGDEKPLGTAKQDMLGDVRAQRSKPSYDDAGKLAAPLPRASAQIPISAERSPAWRQSSTVAPARRRSRRWLWLLIALIAVVAAVVYLFAML